MTTRKHLKRTARLNYIKRNRRAGKTRLENYRKRVQRRNKIVTTAGKIVLGTAGRLILP